MSAPELARSLDAAPSDRIRVIRQQFLDEHPFELTDGRRFKTLECSARSVVQMGPAAMVADMRDSGKAYSYQDCVKILNQMVHVWQA